MRARLQDMSGDSVGQRLREVLAQWAARGWLRPLDAAFADFLWREVPDAPALAILAAALASHQLGRGHACLDLAATLADPAFVLSLPPQDATDPGVDAVPPLPGELLAGVTLEDWLAALRDAALVGAGAGATPLVYVGARLYLRRYWQYEQDVRSGIEQRLAAQIALPTEAVRAALEVLFPGPTPTRVDWQKLGCALAARSAFSVITGGPGTGKTTTVVRLLALLQTLALAQAGSEGSGRALRIRLAAPTGKAAARLNASIAGAVAGLPLAGLTQGEMVRAAIPLQVTTLHRLLGSRPDTRRFRHHAANPLALDVLVVDEASMIDLEMMAALLAALPGGARLILLGDKDQLAAVEAGAVLGELCARAREGHYTPATRDWLDAVTGARIDDALVDAAGSAFDQAVVMLRHSHRFSADSGIGRLAEAVNAGDGTTVTRLWREDHADLRQVRLGADDAAAFDALIIDGGHPQGAAWRDGEPRRHGYAHYLGVLRTAQPAPHAGRAAFDAWAQAVLAAHNQFQVLCALRRGPWGAEGLNRRIAEVLHQAGLLPAREGWYLGRPVLITRNDYALGLMNGDIGITLALPGGPGQGWQPRVAFSAGASGGIRWVLPSRLQAVDTVFALTVHKSQGSEFPHAALVLPAAGNPILTRELLYTAITRARSFFTLANAGGAAVLEQAVTRRVLRASGLLAD